jgi:DNA-binding IclR family transcriptional regulator
LREDRRRVQRWCQRRCPVALIEQESKPLKVYEVMKRANVVNEEACHSLLLKMREEGLVKFDIHKGRWIIA